MNGEGYIRESYFTGVKSVAQLTRRTAKNGEGAALRKLCKGIKCKFEEIKQTCSKLDRRKMLTNTTALDKKLEPIPTERQKSGVDRNKV